MVVNVIGDLAKQDALGFQHAVGFLDERRVGVGKSVALLLRGSKAQAESRVEVLGLVSSLVGDVRRVVNDHIEENGAERHFGIVTDHGRAVGWFDIHADDGTLAASPEAAAVHRRVQYSLWTFAGIEAEQFFQEFGVFSCPHRGQRNVF